MDDPYVRLGWKILRAIPDGPRSYEAVLAVHSLVWTIWQLEETGGQADDDA